MSYSLHNSCFGSRKTVLNHAISRLGGRLFYQAVQSISTYLLLAL
jgi:hypothetical protein